MIRMAKLMGKLVMPRNALAGLLMHGTLWLARGIPAIARYFDELGIKPKNRFACGLFAKGRSSAKLRRGAMLPQGYVRRRDGDIRLSDDAMDAKLTLIGFGVDPYPLLDARLLQQFMAAGGQVMQIAHRGQRPATGTQRCWEDLTGVFLPGLAGIGWVAVVRPDRIILHDGPVAQLNRLVRDSLDLLGALEPAAEPLATQAY
jgi:3-(3-hydroxy-phenyl)propionate hydroxylase